MADLPESGMSYWLRSAPHNSYAPLKKEIVVDTVVVGAGLAGLTTAYLLKQAGQKVAVLEKGTVGGGTSGHTTGKITSQHGLVYADLSKRFGDKVAGLYGAANQAAIGQIERIIRQEKIDCSWRRADNYVYTTDPTKITQFKTEAKQAKKLGLPASLEKQIDLPFKTLAAVKFSQQATFHAGRYVQGLAKAVNGKGSYVYEHSRAIRFHDGQPCQVKTGHGTVTAKNIVVATNVPTFPLLARATYCMVEYPHTSYIVAGKFAGKLSGMYISPDKGHYSLLPVKDGRTQLLLIGGENHVRGWGNSQRREQKLADYGATHFGMRNILYRWQAWDYLAYDDLPLVGKVYPWSKHLFIATAFKKWGLTNTMVSAQLLRDLLTGQPNELADVYTPHRLSPIKSIPRAVKNELRLLF